MGMYLVPEGTKGQIVKLTQRNTFMSDPKPFTTRATNCFFKEEVVFTVFIAGEKHIAFKRIPERGEPGKDHEWILLVPETEVQYG